jgi:hemoglobin
MATKYSQWFAVALTYLMIAGFAAGQDKAPATGKSPDKSLPTVLRTIINSGADLYNRGDHNGCYRLFQGALMATGPQLEAYPDLKKTIDEALANAERKSAADARAYALREALDKVRIGLKGELDKKPVVSPDETIPRVPRPDGTKPAETSPKPPVSKPGETKPLTEVWAKLGGEEKVTKIVDDWVSFVAQDPRVDFTRGEKYKIDEEGMAKLKKNLVDWISQATGGPRKYTGKSMKEIHKDMGITVIEFNAFVRVLQKALDKNKVSEEVMQILLDEVKKTQDEIVETKTQKTNNPDDRRPVFKYPEEKKGNTEDKKVNMVKIDDKKPGDKKPADKKLVEKPPMDRIPVKETAELTGIVTLDGKPLANAEIRFFLKEVGFLKRYWALTDNQGRFAKTIKPGDYVISIRGEDLPIPEKYANPKSSGLEVTVSGKKQTLQLDLKK